jgi:tetratricopeptide (TPR) repeat protein
LGHLEKSMAHGSEDPVVWRNAALATVNTGGDLATADSYFERALELSPDDARLVFERAVLAGLRGLPVQKRIAGIERHSRSVLSRDDLTLLYANLLVDAGRAEEALEILSTRSFQPFEGGEGVALDAYDRAVVRCARTLMEQDPTAAITLLRDGMEAPANLGEGRHPAHSMAERLVALGDALELAGDRTAAAGAWDQACQEVNALAVQAAPAGPSGYWRGIAHQRLGRNKEADGVWRSLETRAAELESAPAAPDYFATSLPELLLFDTDTAAARTETAISLRGLAAEGRREQQRMRRQGEHQKEEATL